MEPSKRQLKRAARDAKIEAEKAAKKAKRTLLKTKVKNVVAAVVEAAEGEDLVPQDVYGDLPMIRSTERVDRKFIRVKSLVPAKIDKKVWLRGHLYRSGATVNRCWMILRQEIYSVYCSAEALENRSRQMIQYIAEIPKESYLEIEGIVKSTAPINLMQEKTKRRIKTCSQKKVKLNIIKVHVINKAAPQLPFTLQHAARPIANNDAVGLRVRLDNRVLDLRTPANQAIFRLEGEVVQLFRDLLRKKKFVEIYTPKLISIPASERGVEVFELSYFESFAYLAQSPQMNKQMAIAGGFDHVFTVGAAFRAVDSNTTRHLCEFVGLDIEMAFNYHYHEVVDLIGEMFVEIFKGLRDNFAVEIAAVNQQYPIAPLVFLEPSLRLEYRDALVMLREDGVEIGDEEGLIYPVQKRLGDLVKARYSTDFYILDKYPSAKSPFYNMPDPTDATYSNSYHMFMRGEKILSGGQRIHHADYLRAQGTLRDLDVEAVKFYIDSFRFGCSPHAGGGIGLERMMMAYLGLDDIRRASMFPRDRQRLTP